MTKSTMALWAVMALAGAVETGCSAVQGAARDALGVEQMEDGSVEVTLDSGAAGASVEQALPSQLQGWGLGALVTSIIGGGASILSERKRSAKEREERRTVVASLHQQIEDLKTEQAAMKPSTVGLKS